MAYELDAVNNERVSEGKSALSKLDCEAALKSKVPGDLQSDAQYLVALPDGYMPDASAFEPPPAPEPDPTKAVISNGDTVQVLFLSNDEVEGSPGVAYVENGVLTYVQLTV